MADIEKHTSRLVALLNEIESDNEDVAWIVGDVTVKYWHTEGDLTSVKNAVLTCTETDDGPFEWVVK